MAEIAVIKCGGSIVDGLSEQFFHNIATLQQNGVKPIIVHGGGPAIQKLLDKLGVPFTFINGLRTTSAAAMNVVEMVLSGQINNTITRKLNVSGIQAVGLSGSDANLITAVPKNFQIYGYVGDVVDVNTLFLERILEQEIVPVIAPIAAGKNADRYNVNADTAAGAIAQATGAGKLIFVTDVPGIIKEEGLLHSASEAEIEDLIVRGVIHGGMIPKVKAAIACLNHNLHNVMIADANQVINDAGFTGTMITKSGEAV
ncbi:N-acetylglutamate kinase [Lentibacillus halodurans]|uniref:Acetylglutamate kinase n=1 Tax=Lentibacillus halodurans TaxID=237679 RepID=A0A1I0W7M1_9BACI|nr:acetylglutamate kinase [Lentibacillus halodurans]SFA84033.1 N-acetylglutamate kinase [Lentibacillus halodurans]